MTGTPRTPCERTRESLEAYLDGQLAAAEAESIRRHLAGCLPCRREEKAARALAERVAALPRSLEPGRDLWPGIAERLAERSGRAPARRRPLQRSGWPAQLAAAAVLVLATAAVTAWLAGRDPEGSGPAAADPAARASLAGHLAAENDLVRARTELAAAFEERKRHLAPETVATVERNLAIVDLAVEEILRALEKDPGDPLLRQYLTAGYQRQVDLLRRASRLPAERGTGDRAPAEVRPEEI